MAVGESRSELLQWLNATLDLNYTKVEKCGTGAAYCQLMDCIYGNVPMHKVKFENATGEYDYRNNMKVLQASFNKHRITKSIDTEKLVKCRLQDNLELLQWFKRLWMENKDVNDQYDAKAMRKSSSAPSNGGTPNPTVKRNIPSRNGPAAAASNGRSTASNNSTSASTATAGTRRPGVTPGRRVSSNSSSTNSLSRQTSNSTIGSGGNGVAPLTPQQSYAHGHVAPSVATNGNSASQHAKVQQLTKELMEANQEVNELTEELQEYKISVESLETERNFYFNKLREIEILTQNIQEQDAPMDTSAGFANDISEQISNLTVADITKQVQAILYSTEEGFDDDQGADDIIDAESF